LATDFGILLTGILDHDDTRLGRRAPPATLVRARNNCGNPAELVPPSALSFLWSSEASPQCLSLFYTIGSITCWTPHPLAILMPILA
jgi:hypothetical protein